MAHEEQMNTVENVGGFDALFSETTESSSTVGNNALSKTQQLTNVATDIANKILQEVANDWENYEGHVKASQKSHDAMDDLINELYNLGSVDVDFLSDIDGEEIDKMIRSQQSKRSRAKSKVMTRENYMTMMVGAVAENLLRIAGNKPKSSGGGVVMKDIGFSDEDLQQLAEFPEDLTKAIRNIQSKKSIMKSKADFSEASPRWKQLLSAEAQLKELRDQGKAAISKEAQEALETKKELEALVSAADADNLNEDDAKELLKKMQEMLITKQ